MPKTIIGDSQVDHSRVMHAMPRIMTPGFAVNFEKIIYIVLKFFIRSITNPEGSAYFKGGKNFGRCIWVIENRNIAGIFSECRKTKLILGWKPVIHRFGTLLFDPLGHRIPYLQGNIFAATDPSLAERLKIERGATVIVGNFSNIKR